MKKFIYFLISATILVSCKDEPKKDSVEQETQKDTLAAVNDDMMEDAIIYEVNMRQYSPEGTFNAFTKDIPRLKELGVDIIWLMPIHPISMKKRKATGELSIEDIEDPEERKKYFGSPYSISDYKAVGEEYGSMEDFDQLVQTAHDNGMYVILDWVANHTGWDHAWIEEHPEFYTKNDNGEITDPINPETGEPWGWTDVADLDFENKELQKEMIQEMIFWVKEHDIDGYRADAAHQVPVPFWEEVADSLENYKSVFMLAEAESPKELFHNAFDMGYNWEGHHIMNNIAQQKEEPAKWHEYMKKVDSTFQDDDILMNFITNHDENSWAGSVKERMGDASESMLVFSYAIPGMPLIYTGQEFDMDKRLKFFEKDTIPTTKGKVYPLLEKLGKLKDSTQALDGGKNAASYEPLEASDAHILAFKREKDGDVLYYIANMSDSEVSFTIPVSGQFTDAMNDSEFTAEENQEWALQPWEYKLLMK